jgi:hypothetical protein
MGERGLDLLEQIGPLAGDRELFRQIGKLGAPTSSCLSISVMMISQKHCEVVHER